ncbi:hypothetical protein [Bacteroides congonensis]
MNIENKLKVKLEEYGFEIEDLTSQELEELKKEIEAEENGMTIIDGVLSNIPPYRRKEENKR